MTVPATWLCDIVERVRRVGVVVRITVIRADGSTPREVGAAMLVDQRGQEATIGGGALELEATCHARAIIARTGEVASPWRRETRDFALGPSLGQCCGGHTRLLFELFTPRELPALAALAAIDGRDGALLLRPVSPGVPPLILCDRKGEIPGAPPRAARVARDIVTGVRPRRAELVAGSGMEPWFLEPCAMSVTPLYIYGAGHVGRALVRVLEGLPFAVTWVDTERSRFPDAIPAHAVAQVAAVPAAAAASAPAGACHIVLTFSHALDLAICFVLLQRADFRFLGLIGSATKRARFLKRLREAGIADGALARLTCPIGIAGLTGKEPSVIAVSVAAQLAAVGGAGPASAVVRTESMS